MGDGVWATAFLPASVLGPPRVADGLRTGVASSRRWLFSLARRASPTDLLLWEAVVVLVMSKSPRNSCWGYPYRNGSFHSASEG
jgi:hypothetical protein